jgi:hypothetical protein
MSHLHVPTSSKSTTKAGVDYATLFQDETIVMIGPSISAST